MTAAKILKMIRSVDPADTKTLDEIDSLVWEYCGYKVHSDPMTDYTRSRDEIKSLRPEGWHIKLEQGVNYWTGLIGKPTCEHGCWKPNFDLFGKTEELTELAGVIQAIEYERNWQE